MEDTLLAWAMSHAVAKWAWLMATPSNFSTTSALERALLEGTLLEGTLLEGTLLESILQEISLFVQRPQSDSCVGKLVRLDL